MIIIEIGRIFLSAIYVFVKLFATENKVTFISRQSNEPSDEFLMIRKEIQRREKDTKVVLLCRTLDGGAESKLLSKVQYGFHMLVQMYHIATSKVVVLDTYCMAISMLKHKKSVTVIQMWHSMGSMKKFGYTALNTREGSKRKLAYAMRMHQNYDYVFASAESYKEHLAKGFRCDIEKIVTMPLPRLDILNDKEYAEKKRNEIYLNYPELKNYPVILYCPTFRKEEKMFEEAVKSLIQQINFNSYRFVVKKHPLSKTELPENVIQAKEFSSFDMLFVADYVISDYSCIVYEAAVLNIPLYFYNYDMDIYLKNRGLAIDYMNELPGVISRDAKEIIEDIENGTYDMKRLKMFSDKYIVPTEHATENIVDFIYACMDKEKK